MKKRTIALCIIMLFVMPIPLSIVNLQNETIPGGSNFQNVTQPEKELSYDEIQRKHFACGGSVDSEPFTTGDWWDTWADDASYLEADSSYYTGIYLVFNITEGMTITDISFFMRWQVVVQGGGTFPTLYWRIYNFDTSSYDTIYSVYLGSTLNFENREESITYDENYVNSTNHVRFSVSASTAYADDITVDYAYLTITKGYDGEFRETLPDDVLYSPDPLEHLACGGNLDSEPFTTGDWWDTWADDASYLTVDSSFWNSIYLIFNITEYTNFLTDNATLNFYLRWQVVLQGGGDVPEVYWKIYNFDTSSYDSIYSMILGTTLSFENREESIIYDENYVNSTNHVRFWIYSNSTYADDITVDYAYLTATNNYTESFADVSDWDDFVAPDAFSSDGDVLTIASTADGANDYEAIYSNSPNSSIGDYLEFRYKSETTSIDYLSVRIYAEDEHLGSMTEYRPAITTSWATYKVKLTQVCESIVLGMRHDTDGTPDNDLQFDYMRIGPSNEMGWQHDCSILQGTTNSTGAFVYDYSTDGDIIQLNISATATSWSNYKFEYDTTSTVAKPERNYYQFLAIKWRMISFTGNYIGLRIDYDDYRYDTTLGGVGYYNKTFDWTTDRINLAAFTTADVESSNVRIIGKFDAGENATVEIDFVKFYSIVNYTVTQSSTGTNETLYVEDGILNSVMDEGYFILDYDQTFLLNGSYSWTKSSSSGESYLSYYSGSWTDYSNETTGTLPYGTTTGLRIKFNETANIQEIVYSLLPPQWRLVGTAIISFDMPNWWVVGVAGSVFHIPIGTYTIQFLLMLMGLVMIPVSTLFLVKGGRDEMSRDKIFLVMMIFFLGWAFFLGGLM